MFLFPKPVESKASKYSGTITVYKFLGKYSLAAANLTQSGGLMHPIWKKALQKIKTSG